MKAVGDRVCVNFAVPLKGLAEYNHKTGTIIKVTKVGIHRFCKVKFTTGEIIEFASQHLEKC